MVLFKDFPDAKRYQMIPRSHLCMLVILANVHCISCIKFAGVILTINQICGVVLDITMITCKKGKVRRKATELLRVVICV